MMKVDTAVVALAGRRIDLPEAQVPRFPLANVQEVGRRICEALCKMHAVALVCSAACGADLVALEQARLLGLRRRIVLPFAPERFRETSVVDRPGDWGPAYDQQVAATAAAADLLVLDSATGGDAAYAAANETIIREAHARIVARLALSTTEGRSVAPALALRKVDGCADRVAAS